jgi:hypothetical protein
VKLPKKKINYSTYTLDDWSNMIQNDELPLHTIIQMIKDEGWKIGYKIGKEDGKILGKMEMAQMF